MSTKAVRRRDKLARRAKREKAAQKRYAERRGREWHRARQPGHWVDAKLVDIHSAIVEFLRKTTCERVPNLHRCRVLSREQTHLSDLAFTNAYIKLGYQKIQIIEEKVFIEVVLDLRDSARYGMTRFYYSYPLTQTWTGLLPNPGFFDELEAFVGSMSRECHRLMEQIRGTRLRGSLSSPTTIAI